MRTSFLVFLACACATSKPGPRATNAAADAISSATAPPGSAKIEARSGSTLSGTAKLVDVDKGLGVHVEVENAAPGLHGVHIHEKADDLMTDPAGNSGARIGCGIILPPTAQPSR